MPIRSQMSLGQIEPEHPELFILEFGKISIYVIIRSQIRSIMDVIGFELSELYALELEHLPCLTLFKI